MAALDTEESMPEDTTIDGLGCALEEFLLRAQHCAENAGAKRSLDFAWLGMTEVSRGDFTRLRMCSALRQAVQHFERVRDAQARERSGGEDAVVAARGDGGEGAREGASGGRGGQRCERVAETPVAQRQHTDDTAGGSVRSDLSAEMARHC